MESAHTDLDTIGNFLQENWSPEIAIRFLNAFYKSLDVLEKAPEIGLPSSFVPGVRRKMIDKYNTMYYEFLDGTVFVLRIIDTRSNPDENPY